jgi:hypothetical protein
MNSGDLGTFNKLRYDTCAYQKYVSQSVSPLQYRMSMDTYENIGKCTYDAHSNYHPYDNVIVDTESELKGIRRKASSCVQNQYDPTCVNSETCTNTFDPSVPIVFPQEICPIVKNNLPQILGPGYELSIDHN